jgi:hypothetical protein
MPRRVRGADVNVAAIGLLARQGQEWTNEEDLEVMLQLRSIRQGNLTHKNMTVREAEKIQDVLKVI